MRSAIIIIHLLLIFKVTSQVDAAKSAAKIPKHLLSKADAVIRTNYVQVTVQSVNRVLVKTDRVITVLNESGMKHVNAIEYYDDNRKIKEMDLVVYDSNGKRLKEFSKKDFKEFSAVEEGTLYQDNRILMLQYFPVQYPVTFHYNSEVLIKSTAFLPSWMPIDAYRLSNEKSSLSLTNNTDIQVKAKKMNFEGFPVLENAPFTYEIGEHPAIAYNSYSLGLEKLVPIVKFALSEFEMEGVRGVNEDWKTFGRWINESLLDGTTDLPNDVKAEITSLTKNATSEREKAKIVYSYMQNRSRYISVQVGIGGWKPIDASSVHKTSYGDCKGLSNYTQALLKEVGVKSEYTIIYGDSRLRDIDKDFSSTQGNHAILHLPKLDGEKDLWLECTSKNSPFGYIAGFTDDRDALVITEQGGIIKHTTVYPADDNTQISFATVSINENGDMDAVFEMQSAGYQYYLRQDLEEMTEQERILNYKERWVYINDLKVEPVSYNADREKIIVSEKMNLSTRRYASKSGDRFVFLPNIFNRNTDSSVQDLNREQGFQVSRGYKDIDNYEIELPAGFIVEAIPESVDIKTIYGSYELKIEKKTNGNLSVKRTFGLHKGIYQKEQFEEFRTFQIEVAKADNTKVVIVKK